MKAVIILVDGMRPDGLMEIPYAKAMSEKASFTMNARTVYPSVTLPCHMSLFHSVDPSRHGVTTNTYTPQVRPVKGLCEVLNDNGKTCARSPARWPEHPEHSAMQTTRGPHRTGYLHCV